jgi:hypothetical protein
MMKDDFALLRPRGYVADVVPSILTTQFYLQIQTFEAEVRPYIFYKSVLTAYKTQLFTITNISWFMLFK